MEEPVLPLDVLHRIERRWQELLSRQAAQSSKPNQCGMQRLADVGQSSDKEHRANKKEHRAKSKRLQSSPV